MRGIKTPSASAPSRSLPGSRSETPRPTTFDSDPFLRDAVLRLARAARKDASPRQEPGSRRTHDDAAETERKGPEFDSSAVRCQARFRFLAPPPVWGCWYSEHTARREEPS
jgi:hypothetical protein